MIEQIKICHHNVARGRDIQQSLFEVALKADAQLLFIQEPYLYSHAATQQLSPLSHPSYIPLLPSYPPGIRPRVVTYVQRQWPFEISPRPDLVDHPDLQLFEVICPSESFFIFHMYN